MLPMMSTRPNSDCARSTSASTSARFVTSMRCTTAVPPSALISSAVACAPASSMSPPTIVAPASAEHPRGRLADAAPDAGEHRHLAREVEQVLHAATVHPSVTADDPSRGAYVIGPAVGACGADTAQNGGAWPLCSRSARGSATSTSSRTSPRSAAGSSRSCRRACCRSCPATSRWSPASTSPTSQDEPRSHTPPHRRHDRAVHRRVRHGVRRARAHRVGPRAARCATTRTCSRGSRARSCSRWRCSSSARCSCARRGCTRRSDSIRSSAGSASRRRSSPASRSVSVGRRASGRSSDRSSASPRTQDRVWAGGTLLVAYSLGLGLPFLVDRPRARPRRRRARAG